MAVAVASGSISVSGVSHAFVSPDPTQTAPIAVLQNVSLQVESGTFVSLLGPSGCGKTTLLRIMHGLIRPASGEVQVNGRPVQGPPEEAAMVFQDHNLLPWRRAIENVEFGLELAGMSERERRERARSMLAMVGLEGFERAFPHQLSGGMRQRVGLARAWCMDPQILLMDEPFGALDAQARELMQDELLRIWEQDRKTVVFVTHSIDEAIYLADRVLVMDARPGRIKEDLPVDLPRPAWITTCAPIRRSPRCAATSPPA